MNKRYKVSEEFDYSSRKKLPVLTTLEVAREGKQLKLSKRYAACGYCLMVNPDSVFVEPQKALESYRQKLINEIMCMQEELAKLQTKLDSLPGDYSKLPVKLD